MTEIENIEKILYMGVGRSGLENESSIIAKALSELMEYRAIGTVEHIQVTFELCKGLDCMVKMYEAIGTIEEFKALKEKNTPMELAEHNFQDEVHHYLCPSCRNIVSCNQNYCEECGQALET